MKSFAERLQEEAESWVREGVISREQATRLAELHPITTPGSSRLVGMFSIVGGGIVLVGVSLVISANWERIGDWVKIAFLVMALVGAHATAWLCKEGSGKYPKIGDMFTMIGCGLFLSGIALISQIFHLNDRPANGVLLWFVGIAPVGWLARSKGAHFLTLAGFFIWIAMEFNAKDSLLWGGSHDEFMVAAFFALLASLLWLLGLFSWKGAMREFSGVHEHCGLMIACAALYFLGFYRHSAGYSSRGDSAHFWFVGVLSGILAMLTIGFGILAVSQKDEKFKLIVPWVIAAQLPPLMILWRFDLQDHGWLWSAGSWVALLAVNLVMLQVGTTAGRPSWINIAAVFIGLNVITRYFDLFGSMMEGGIFFIVTGLLIVALCFYIERKRRSMIAMMAMRNGFGKEVRAHD